MTLPDLATRVFGPKVEVQVVPNPRTTLARATAPDGRYVAVVSDDETGARAALAAALSALVVRKAVVEAHERIRREARERLQRGVN